MQNGLAWPVRHPVSTGGNCCSFSPGRWREGSKRSLLSFVFLYCLLARVIKKPARSRLLHEPCQLIFLQRQQPERLQRAWQHRQPEQRPERFQPVWLQQPVPEQLQPAWHRQPGRLQQAWQHQQPERLRPAWLQQQVPVPGQQQVPVREPGFLSGCRQRGRWQSGQQQEATTFSFLGPLIKNMSAKRVLPTVD